MSKQLPYDPRVRRPHILAPYTVAPTGTPEAAISLPNTRLVGLPTGPSASAISIPNAQLVGFQFETFTHVNVGGPGNLRPGFLERKSAPLIWPSGIEPGHGWVFLMLTGYGAAFVNESGSISDQNLGQVIVNCFFSDDVNKILCDFLLMEDSQDKGVNMFANVQVLFFK